MSPGLKTSVIICTMDRPEDLARALHSLESQTLPPDEVVIVDASREEGLGVTLLQTFPFLPIRYIHTRPPGLTRQRNIGIRESSGEILVFFDDDVLLERQYLECVVRVFLNDPASRIGAVQGRITNFINSRTSPPLRLKDLTLSILLRVFLLPRVGSGAFQLSGFQTLPYDCETPRFIECLQGCAMSFRRALFDTIAFDEKLIGYTEMEDADIARQVGRRALIYYEPGARVRHMYSPVARQQEFSRQRQLVQDYAYVARKHGPPSFFRRAAIWWSVLGLCVLHTMAGRWDSCRGVVSGAMALALARMRRANEHP